MIDSELSLLECGTSVDSRGSVTFANGFPLFEFKRFYVIRNTVDAPIRAWHAHHNESKAFFPVNGSFVIGAIKVPNWEKPPLDQKPEFITLDANSPKALFVPAGYANGIFTLSKDAEVLVFSSSSLEDSVADDFRFPLDTWKF
jgi:dTDP-4-dehydrorhamnose 3,5-epimerase